MRKIFTTLKSVIAIAVIASMTLAASCSYDDSAINKRVDKVEKDLTALVERVEKLEESLQQQAPTLEELLGNKAVIVEVTTNEAGDTVIKLSNGKEITVLAPADSLQYRVVDGVLEVSADGENWVAVKVAPEQVVADVVISEDGKTATVILADGQEFVVGVAELIECEAASNGVYIPAGESKEIALSINDAVAEINIMNQPFGWSAEVEALDETRAVGGKNFVLKINAPAQDLVAAGYAAQSGVVSVHFNTAAGACKVLSVNVNLAKLSLDIDKDGNITIVNSLVEMKRSMIWGDHEGFANFFIGVVYKSDYEAFDGNLQNMMNYGYPISFNQHDNLAFFNKEYEPGVYDEEVVTFTVQELLDEFNSVGMGDVSFEYGEEYVIYIAKTNSVGDQDLKNLLVVADYKALQVAAEKVEGSETWNGADYKFTIIGYQYALIGYVPQREVDQLIEFGQCSDLDSFYDFYIASAENYGYPNIGSLVDLSYEPWNEYLITANQLSQMYQPITPNTEYRLYALCFNYADFESGRAFNHEDIYDFGTFTTTDLKAGDFDVVASTELVSWDPMGVKANIYLTDDVQLSYSKIFDDASVDQESRIQEMLADAYFEGGSEIEIYQYVGDATEIYVGVIAVNANGEYAYEEVVFKKPEPVAITSFEYLGRYWEIADEDESTNGGEFVYLAKCADGNEFTINIYYAYCNADGSIIEGTYDYCTNMPDYMYSSWAGFAIISDTYYYDSKLVVEADKITLSLAGVADYVYIPGQGGEQPVEDSFTYLGRYYDLDDDDSTSGGDYVYKVVAGGVEYQLGLYYEYAEADGTIKAGVYSYCYNAFDVMYSSWNGFIIKSDSYYYGSTLTANAEGVTLHLTDADGVLIGDYFFAGVPVSGDIEEPEPAESYVFTSSFLEASSGFGDFYITFATEDESVKVRLNFYNCQDADKNFLPEMTYPVGSTYPAIFPNHPYSWVNINGAEYTLVYNQGSVTVSEIEGQMYRFDIAVVANDGAVVVNGVYEGAIEGMVVPSEWVEPEPPVMQETTEWTIDYHHTSYGGKPGYSEHELYFLVDATTYAVFDFTNVDSEGRVLAGTYDFTNGLNTSYCTTTEGTMTSATVVVTDGEDANSKNFDVTFVVDEYKPYHFTYSSTIYPVE